MSFFRDKIRYVLHLLTRNKVIFENFSYVALFQVLNLLFPLITFPYLTRVLGQELYGLVITAQILSSYCSIIVSFGFLSVSARHISLNRDNKDKLSEIISSILCVQFVLWILSFVGYIGVVNMISIYKSHFLLFFFSFFLTLPNILFPQYYFQGIEKMKYITLIQLIFQLVFVGLIFLVIKRASDYVYVPLLYSVGYLLGGIAAFYVIFVKHKIVFRIPSFRVMRFYIKDASSIFATDAICTIKDKLNYLLLGGMVSMGDVVTYDVGSKLTGLINKPIDIIRTVIFPKMARDKNDMQFKKIGLLILGILILLVVVVNIFLPYIVYFLVGKHIYLLPVRLYLLAPIFLGISVYIAQCLLIARGYNKYLLYSIIITTVVYLLLLCLYFFSGRLNTVTAFVSLTVLSFLVEVIYRLIVARRIFKGKL